MCFVENSTYDVRAKNVMKWKRVSVQLYWAVIVKVWQFFGCADTRKSMRDFWRQSVAENVRFWWSTKNVRAIFFFFLPDKLFVRAPPLPPSHPPILKKYIKSAVHTVWLRYAIKFAKVPNCNTYMASKSHSKCGMGFEGISKISFCKVCCSLPRFVAVTTCNCQLGNHQPFGLVKEIVLSFWNLCTMRWTTSLSLSVGPTNTNCTAFYWHWP